MNVRKFLRRMRKNLVFDSRDILEVYERAFDKAGFDFENDSADFIKYYIDPGMRYIQMILDGYKTRYDDIMRKHGVSELQITWGNYQGAELTELQKVYVNWIVKRNEWQTDNMLALTVYRRIIEKRWPPAREMVVEGVPQYKQSFNYR